MVPAGRYLRCVVETGRYRARSSPGDCRGRSFRPHFSKAIAISSLGTAASATIVAVKGRV